MFGWKARAKELEAILAEREDNSEALYGRINNLEVEKQELVQRIKTLLTLRDDGGLAEYALQVADNIEDIYARGSSSAKARRVDIAMEVQRAMRTAVSGTDYWWDNYGKKPGDYPEPKPQGKVSPLDNE